MRSMKVVAITLALGVGSSHRSLTMADIIESSEESRVFPRTKVPKRVGYPKPAINHRRQDRCYRSG